MILGEAGGMMSLNMQTPSYPRAKEKQKRSQGAGPDGSLSLVRNALARGVLRIGLVGLLENGIQIYLQTAYFSIKRVVAHDGSPHWQAMFSILLSLAMMGGKIREAR